MKLRRVRKKEMRYRQSKRREGEEKEGQEQEEKWGTEGGREGRGGGVDMGVGDP